MYGSYATIEDTPTLTFERRLSHPVERVWRAITEPGELGHWFPSKVVVDELVPDAEMSFEFEDMPLDLPSTMTGRVTDVDPPRLFGFYWGEDHLRFELDPAQEGCKLRLTVALGARDKAARDAAGWHVCLDRLEEQLGSAGAGREWRGYYDEYQRRGVPAGAPIPGE
ncbi:MAG TPA: SRPBCC family protein [Solirubrobacteraceae bacterium]|nr:SRPBCC family protein [Solirubrobacteraceae bacterium]HTT29008.1 SRPBCC family protein [Solirubrobacteraceae bacterium]